MTTQVMVELVKKHHPQLSETEIVSLLNRAKNRFCEETDILKETDTSLTTTASTLGYTLPTGTLKVYDVYVDTDRAVRVVGRPKVGDGNGLSSGIYYYWIENGTIYICTGGASTAYVDAGLAIVVYRSYLDADITADGEAHTMELPSRYHEALVDWAIARGYKQPPVNTENAIFFDKNYKITLKEAIKNARSDKRDYGIIKPYDY